MKEVVWSPKAKMRYTRLLHYLMEHKSKVELKAVLEGVEKMVETIAVFPRICQMYDDDKRIRRAVIAKRCIMLYRLEDDKIEIIGVFDARQDLSSIDI